MPVEAPSSTFPRRTHLTDVNLAPTRQPSQPLTNVDCITFDRLPLLPGSYVHSSVFWVSSHLATHTYFFRHCIPPFSLVRYPPSCWILHFSTMTCFHAFLNAVSSHNSHHSSALLIVKSGLYTQMGWIHCNVHRNCVHCWHPIVFPSEEVERKHVMPVPMHRFPTEKVFLDKGKRWITGFFDSFHKK